MWSVAKSVPAVAPHSPEVVGELGRRGRRALLIRASAHDRDAPYRLLYRLVSSMARNQQAGSSTTQLLEAIAIASQPGMDADRVLTNRIADALAIALAGERPITVAVDDAHHADPASAQPLADLAPQLAVRSASIVLAVRAGMPGPLRERLATTRYRRTLTLRRLSRRGTASMIYELVRGMPEDDFSRRLYRDQRQSGRHP